MSILQDYEQFRKNIGEQEYGDIEQFLEVHPDYYLSDVCYRESVWNEFKEWQKSK